MDRLLASEHYGQRMFLPRLEAARYTVAKGFQEDGDTFQWIRRDRVVKATTDKLPFHQFIVEQTAHRFEGRQFRLTDGLGHVVKRIHL